MQNRMIIPPDSPFSPDQRAKIRDIWTGPPIGIRSLLGDVEYPDLIVSPNYSAGKQAGRDSRGISIKPISGDRFEVVVVSTVPDYQKANPKISPEQIQVERGGFFLRPNRPSDRYALSTRVSPTRCEMTYRAVIDVDPKDLAGLKVGRLWASDKVLEAEEEQRKWDTEHPSIFTGFF